MRKVVNIVLAVIVCILFCGCDKEKKYNNIPFADVDFMFSPHQHRELTSYGGIKFFKSYGYKNNGVYVCQLSADGSNGYRAFDATCPNEGATAFDKRLEIEPKGILKLKCNSCGSVFYLNDKRTGLREYRVVERAFGELYQVTSW